MKKFLSEVILAGLMNLCYVVGMNPIRFTTGNKKKIDAANKVLNQYGFDIESCKVEIADIQTDSVEELLDYKTQEIRKVVSDSFIISSVGYHIKALNGFPGIYTNYINKTLSAEQLLALMQGEEDRSFLVNTCVSFFNSQDGSSKLFYSKGEGFIALEAKGEGTSLDQIMIRSDMQDNQATYSYDQMIEYYANKYSHYHQLGKYLQSIQYDKS